MFFGELISALVIAALLAVIVASLFGWQHPVRAGTGPAILFLFLILFALTWSIGVWVEDFGPPVWGVYWLPFLLVGLVFTLLIIGLIPPGGRSRPADATAKAEADAEAFLGGVFWILFVILAVSLIVHYV